MIIEATRHAKTTQSSIVTLHKTDDRTSLLFKAYRTCCTAIARTTPFIIIQNNSIQPHIIKIKLLQISFTKLFAIVARLIYEHIIVHIPMRSAVSSCTEWFFIGQIYWQTHWLWRVSKVHSANKRSIVLKCKKNEEKNESPSDVETENNCDYLSVFI